MSSDVRGRMIERTAILLAKKGLQGTSFTDILEASGAPRGSLYHHFPGGKDELVLAAIAHARDQAMAVLDRLEGQPAVQVAEAFIGLWRSVLVRSGFSAGCAVLAVTVASQPATPSLELAATIFRDWRHRLAALLAAGGVAADRAPGLAAMLIAACEGAVVLARAEQSLEPFDMVAAEQSGLIAQAVGAPLDGR